MIRQLLPLVSLTLTIFVTVGCATLTVGSHVERGADFSQYRSFDWGTPDALPVNDPRYATNPFFKDYLQGAVEKELARRGMMLANGEPPDVLIHYHANIRRQIDPTSLDWASGYDAAFDSGTRVTSVEEATFVLDFIDARTNRLIWRGWAQRRLGDSLDDREHLAETIDESVGRMLLRLPF